MACTVELRNAYKVLILKYQGKRLLGNLMRRWNTTQIFAPFLHTSERSCDVLKFTARLLGTISTKGKNSKLLPSLVCHLELFVRKYHQQRKNRSSHDFFLIL